MKNDAMPPQNIEAEESVLGALLIDPAAANLISFLKPAHFSQAKLRWIYESISALIKRQTPPDLTTVADELERRKKLQMIGGAAFLTQLINSTPTSTHIEHYAKIVRRCAVNRFLLRASGQIAMLAQQDNDDVNASLRKSIEIIHSISTDNGVIKQPVSVGQLSDKLLDHLDTIQSSNGVIGLPTGLTDLDKLLGGYQKGRFYLVAGRPGMGKSSLTLQGARAMSKADKAALYFSLEMPDLELALRLWSQESGVSFDTLSRGPIDDYKSLYDSLDKLIMPLYIDHTTRDIDDIRAVSTVLAGQGNLDCIVVDSLQLVTSSARFANRDESVGNIGRCLKNLAMDLDVPVVAVSNLNRACESRQNKRPMLADLRESGSLEYHADVVMFLYRDEVYYPNTEAVNVSEIIVAKNREGPTGHFSAYYRKSCMLLQDLQVRRTPLHPLEGSPAWKEIRRNGHREKIDESIKA